MKEQPEIVDELLRRRLYDAVAPPPPEVWPAVEGALRRRRRRWVFWLALLGVCTAGALGYWGLRTMDSGVDRPQQKMDSATIQRTETAMEGSPSSSVEPAAALSVGDHGMKVSGAGGSRRPETQLQSSSSGILSASVVDEDINTEDAASGLAQEMIKEAPGNLPAGVSASSLSVIEAGVSQPFASAVALLSVPEPKPFVFHRKQGPLPNARIILPKKKKDQKSCYDFEDHPNVWFADVYAGPLVSRRSLETEDPEFLQYRRLRSETERPDLAFNAGVRASLLLNRHYLLRTGLHYDQVTEVFEYADPNYIEYTVKVRSELINGVWQTITDTIGVDYGEHYQKVFNRYGMLDIPFMAGGEWRQGRTGFSVQAGATVNLLFWQRGTMLNPQSMPVRFNQEPEQFRVRTGLSLMGSVQWFWHLQPRLRVFVEPYYRHVMRPVTLETHPIRQRYDLLGIQFGLTKILD